MWPLNSGHSVGHEGAFPARHGAGVIAGTGWKGTDGDSVSGGETDV